ncbi:stage V sporulation protein AD, partial [bacterium]|nr:stage V sporulation protein AD [bacterium]
DLYKEMLKGRFEKVLLVPTGALLSKISNLQGETIPAIAHAVSIEKI